MQALGARWKTGIVLLAVAMMVGCQGVKAGSPAPQSGHLVTTTGGIDFGSVIIGQSGTQSVTLVNSAPSNISVTAVSVTGSDFRYSGPSIPMVVAAGQSMDLAVDFVPLAAGSVTGSISISSSDTPDAPITIPLSGTAADPGQLAASAASIAFGSVQVGSTQTVSETLTNSGDISVTITQATISGTGFHTSGLTLPLTLAAGQGTTFSVTFTPASASTVSGTLAIISNAANSTLNVAVSGTGTSAAGTLTANPVSLSFGSIQVGTNKSLSETLTNSGSSSVTITAANASGTGFSISGLTLPTTLTAGQSVTFNATFTPASATAASGNISVTSNATNPSLSISMSGTGTALGTLSVTPSPLAFGSVTVGSTKPLTGTLSASGAAVTVSSASVNSSEFTISGLLLPATINAGQSKTFTMTFAPASSGAASGTASFISNASNSTATQSLTGTGTTPAAHSVDLVWIASTSAGAVGYNIYRGTVSGGPYSQVNIAVNADTTYTDTTVLAGQTYFFVTTAVDSTGGESGFSNQATAAVPTP